MKHVESFDVADEKSDDYLDARYDAAIERAEKSEDALSGARQTVEGGAAREDGATPKTEDQARADMAVKNKKRFDDHVAEARKVS